MPGGERASMLLAELNHVVDPVPGFGEPGWLEAIVGAAVGAVGRAELRQVAESEILPASLPAGVDISVEAASNGIELGGEPFPVILRGEEGGDDKRIMRFFLGTSLAEE